MKKLFIIALICIGTSSFASVGKHGKKSIKSVNNTEVLKYYCTVGDVTVSSAICNRNACQRGHDIYCAGHGC